jgi:hypothetical protein
MDETIQELNYLLNKGLAGAPEGFILYTFYGVQKRNFAAQRAAASASYPPLGSLITSTVNSISNLIGQYNTLSKNLTLYVGQAFYSQLVANLATIEGNINVLTTALGPYVSVAASDVKSAQSTLTGWQQAASADVSSAISTLLGWAAGL